MCIFTVGAESFRATTIKPDIDELLKYLATLQGRLGSAGCKLICGYEAGCLGYTLYRQLTYHMFECVILAPTTMPSTPKEIKTDKRDALKIAKHLVWLRSLKLDNSVLQETLAEYLVTYDQLSDKVERFDRRIEELAQRDAYREKVNKLVCFKGIRTHTALSLIVEVETSSVSPRRDSLPRSSALFRASTPAAIHSTVSGWAENPTP